MPPPTSITAYPISKAAAASSKQTQRFPFQSPWAGYTPDMAVPAEQPSGLTSCRSLVVFSGVLTTEHGWAQIGPDTLPLGNDNGTSGYSNGANTYGSGIVAADPTVTDVYTQPVRHVASFQRFTAAAGVGIPEILAVTAATAAPDSGLGVIETGHLFSYSGGSWASREFRARGSDGSTEIAGAAPLSGTVDEWVDSAVYPLGVTGGSVGSAHVQPVSEAVFLFTNYQDEVMYFPSANGAGAALGPSPTGWGVRYAPFLAYATQIKGAGAASTFYSGDSSVITNFRAKTLSVFDGRAWYGNTVEDNVFRGTRLRRSIVGNPLIIWPGFELANAGGLNLNGVGAGFIDLEQFQTPIQRILPLGDLLAVYSKDGIAVVRRTGSQAAPYAIQYVTLERGLLSPGAVVSINPAQHFAVLSDGWYLINANGTIQEVGLSHPAPLRTGEINYKWKADFYTRLNSEATDDGHLQTGYEPEEQFVRISTPMGAGGAWPDNTDPTAVEHTIANEVWIYDLKNDRVFLDDYTGVNEQDESPLVWAVVIRPQGEFVSWDDITGGTATPWNLLDDPGTWSSLSPSFGGNIVTHGDTNGFVYIHDHSISTRDGDLPEWEFISIPHNYRLSGAGERMLQRVDLQYQNNEDSTSIDADITATAYSNDNGDATTSAVSEVGALNLRRGNPNQMGQSYAHFRLVGDHHQIQLSGTGQVKIHSISLEFQNLEGRYRRREGM